MSGGHRYRFGTGALGRVVRSGVGRRRVQTLVIAVSAMMAVASSVVAGALMVAADAPFDHAFAQQRGAHLTAQFDPAEADADRLAATGRLDGVSGSAGPYPSVTVLPVDGRGGHLPGLTLVGRARPDADVDDLDLRSGRWAQAPGEVVLDPSFAGPGFGLGDTFRSSDGAGGRTLTVVGTAVSAGRTADGWALPGTVTALGSRDAPVSSQMLYRLDDAGTKADVAAGRERLAAAVPRGALLGTGSYLDAKLAADRGAAPTVPFLMAFGVLGIAMSVIIVGGVVSGAVGTNLRRIGILKAIGFTPREVVRAYVAQALIPAAGGVALGVVLGNLLALPLLEDTEEAYGDTSLTVAWWVDAAVAAGALLVVAVAALVPALRAGRLRTVEAIAVGRAPRTGRGRWAHRAAGRLPVPRPVAYGLAAPFARPVRAAAMVLAVAFGTVAATFAVGLTASLNAVGDAQDPEDRAAVTVVAGGAREEGGGPAPRGAGGGPAPQREAPAGGAPAAPDPGAGAGPEAVRAAVEAQPGTASSYGKTQVQGTVGGVTGSVRISLYQGDSRPGAYAMVSGRWIGGAGQAVVPTRLLERTGTEVGDALRVTYQGDTQILRIVGEAFDTADDGLRVHADLSSFAAARPAVFLVELEPGVSAARYAEELAAVVRPLGGDVLPASTSESGSMIIILEAMAALLTLMLVSVAGLGVLNSVVLDTRERVRDIGVCKALGMTPRQTTALVLASVAGAGVLGGLVGVPAGYALHGLVLPMMGDAAGTGLPPSVLEVYDAPRLALLGLAGVAIALLGALLPAGWAARTRTGTALRTE